MEELIPDNYIESIRIFLTFSSQDKHSQIANGFKNKSVLIAKLCQAPLTTGYSCKEIDSTFFNPKDSLKGICSKCYDKIESLHPKLKLKKIDGNCLCGDYFQYGEHNFCFHHRMSPSETNDLNHIKGLFDCYFEELSALISRDGLSDRDVQEIKSQITLLFNLCETSVMIRNFISGFLLKNYPVLTKHFCFIEGGGVNSNCKDDYDSDNDTANDRNHLIDNDSEDLALKRSKSANDTYLHKCQCFFLQNLYRYMIDKKFPQSDLPRLFNEEKYTLCYLFLFDSSFFIRIIENEALLENLFEEISSYMKYCLNPEYFCQAKCEKIITLFEHLTSDFSFLTTKALEILSTNNAVLITLVTCLSYLQNMMPFNTFVVNEREEEKEECQLLLVIEKIILELFSMLTNIFDYTHKQRTEEVIHELLFMLKKRTYLSQSLKPNEYSFHIPVNRALAIFLSKNILAQELISQSNPNDILNGILTANCSNDLGNVTQMLSDITAETLKCIGFINSISFMPNENDCLMYYSKQYYSLELFYLCDYSLIKLLLSPNSDGSLLELPSLLAQMNTCSIYDQILNSSKLDTLSMDAQGFFAENLRTVSCILLNNSFFLNLIVYTCLVSPDFYCNEHIKDKLQKHLKCLMTEKITMVLLKKKKVSESEMSGKFPKGFTEKAIEKLLAKIAVENKMHKSKNLIEYKVNTNYLEGIELNTIIPPKLYHQARTCLSLAGKANNLFLCATAKSPSCLRDINSCLRCYFLFKTHNVAYCIKLLKAFLSNSDVNNLSNEFIYQNLKVIYIYIANQSLLEHSSLHSDMDSIGLNSSFSSEINSLLRYPLKHTPTYEDLNVFYNKQIKRRSKKTSAQLVQKQARRCCECNELLPEKLTGTYLYGQLGLVVTDSFLFHIHLQTIKAAFKAQKQLTDKVILKQLMLDYHANYTPSKRGLKVITCKDFIHYHCFNKIISNSVGSFNVSNPGDNIIMLCPNCKQMFNCFMPLFSLDEEESLMNSNEHLQGLTLSQALSASINRDTTDHIVKVINSSTSSANIPNKSKPFSINDDILNGVLFFIQKLIGIQNVKGMDSSAFSTNSRQEGRGGKEIEIIQHEDYVALLHFYNNLTEMIYRYKYSKDMDMLQRFIISLKCLIRAKRINDDIFMDKFQQIMIEDSNYYDEYTLLDYNKIEAQYNEVLFLLLILFDFSEYQYWKYILMNYLPYLYLQFYIWSHYTNSFVLKAEEIAELLNIRHLNAYLLDHSNELLSFLQAYLDKSFLVISVFNEEEYSPMTFTEYINKNHLVSIKSWNVITLLTSIAYPKFWRLAQTNLASLLEGYSKRKFDYLTRNSIKEDMVNPFLLLVNTRRRFEALQLPVKKTDFLSRYGFQSTHLNVPHYYSIVCLICGEKVCYTKDCCYIAGKHSNLDQYQYHNIICGKGNGIYVSVYNGTVIFAIMGIFHESKRRLFDSEKKNKKDMCLIKSEYEVIVEEFANLSFVKYYK